MPYTMKNLYIDIDGVLLIRNLQVPEDAELFIDYCVTNFNCYWLTTHCKEEAKTAWTYVSQFYPATSLPIFQQIQATQWDTLKTEAIDFTTDFYWIDDFLMEAENAHLQQKTCLNKLLAANLKNERELNRILGILRSAGKPSQPVVV